jgi:hypothetical protein
MFNFTPGPWRWEVNETTKTVSLQGGKPKYDCTVMDFVRWGMQSAMPRFVVEPKPYLNIMKPMTDFMKISPGREHHSSWFKIIDHPDANLIAASPDLYQALKEVQIYLNDLIDAFNSDGLTGFASKCLEIRNKIDTAIIKADGANNAL